MINGDTSSDGYSTSPNPAYMTTKRKSEGLDPLHQESSKFMDQQAKSKKAKKNLQNQFLEFGKHASVNWYHIHIWYQ